MSAALDVVVVTYGQRDLVRQCLDSLREHPPAIPTAVHVVDNDSPDDTPDVVAAEHPEVHLVRRPTNDGFAVANNAILRDSRADYVLLLNPDAAVGPGTIDHLLDVLEREPDIGVIGCRLLTADGTPDHAAKRFIPSPATALRYFALRAVGRTGSGYVAPEIADDAVADVDAVNGAFMLVRRSAMDEVGLLDEGYWMYAEDLDWCTRFKSAGWRVVYDGRAIARHVKGASSNGPRRLRLNYHFHRSMARFYRRHVASGNLFVDGPVEAAIWMRFGATAGLNAVRRTVSNLTGPRSADA